MTKWRKFPESISGKRGSAVKQTEVLIIGCGIAGCTTAYTLAKRGVQVTMIAPWSEPFQAYAYGAEEGISYEALDDSPHARVRDWNAVGHGFGSARALEFLAQEGPKVVEELLLDDLQLEFDRNQEGSWCLRPDGDGGLPRSLTRQDYTAGMIFEALWKKLESCPTVEILRDHHTVELLTLAHHSTRSADLYKKPTCVGAYVFCAQTNEVKTILAKETVLAMAGVAGLFRHSALPNWIRGESLGLGHQAGARVLNTDLVTFHPLSLYSTNGATLPLPDTLRRQGGKILAPNKEPFLHAYFDDPSRATKEQVVAASYREVQRQHVEHLWLDLTEVDDQWIEENCPRAVEQCAARGYDLGKDLLPIVPCSHLTCGGVAVDRVGQSTVYRLRAVGQGTCTGVHGAYTLPTVALLETIVWGRSCGEDIAKQVGRFAYSFPEVRSWEPKGEQLDEMLADQDWETLRHTSWTYLGPHRDRTRLRRALAILQPLWQQIERAKYSQQLSPSVLGLVHGVRSALCMVYEALHRDTGIGVESEGMRSVNLDCVGV